MTTEDYVPTEDPTPPRPQRVIDPKEATTRRWRCSKCGMLNDPPPVALPLEPRVTALDPMVAPELGPFYPAGKDKRIAETEEIKAPVEK